MTAGHRYGPHRDEDAPNSVTVLGPGTTQGGRPFPSPEVRPIPEWLRQQRREINTMAYEAALAAHLELEADDSREFYREHLEGWVSGE